MKQYKIFKTNELNPITIKEANLTEIHKARFHTVSKLKEKNWFIQQGCLEDEEIIIIEGKNYHPIKDNIKYRIKRVVKRQDVPSDILLGMLNIGFSNSSFIDIQSKESEEKIWVQGELLDKSNNPYFDVFKWLLDQGLKNEEILFIYDNNN